MAEWNYRNSEATARGASDAELVLSARRGEKRAFVEIVARHQAMVCGVAFAILNDFAASEDAAQEAFLTAWRKIHELREPERLRAWLGQISRNSALASLRRKRPEGGLDDCIDIPDACLAPNEAAACEEEAELVRKALDKLPEIYRLPLVLFYREGQSVCAVAESLAISEDAVKQRLARGRDMLRERMEGVLERVLTRTGPSAVFTMAIAAAIGALAAPSVIAGSVFTAGSVSAGAGSTTTSTTLFSAMGTTKGLAAAAAIIAVVCIPAGYHLNGVTRAGRPVEIRAAETTANARDATNRPSFENTRLFAEWRALHDRYGTNAVAMSAIYGEVNAMKESVRKRAFRAALFAEWAAVDGSGGMDFLLGKNGDAAGLEALFHEWFELDPNAAVNRLLSENGPQKQGCERLLRASLKEIARKIPERVAEVAARLPKSKSIWDRTLIDAFAILAESNLESARQSAEQLPGPNREHALAGVAEMWAKTDIDAALRWAKQLPDVSDRDELIRATLIGLARTDVKGALDRVSLVPAGGRANYFAATTGARVLKEAAQSDFEGAVSWLNANPGRLSRQDVLGIADAVADRMNADATAFLTTHSNDGSLGVLVEAVQHALLNEAAGLRPVVWDWLKQQPGSDVIDRLKSSVIRAAAMQEPELAFKMVTDFPTNAEGDKQVNQLGRDILAGGWRLPIFDQLYDKAPARLRPALLKNAFDYVGSDAMDDPQPWLRRSAELPNSERQQVVSKIARGWAMKRPEEAASWLQTVPEEDSSREFAVGAVAAAWLEEDERGALAWMQALPPGATRDLSVEQYVYREAAKAPEQALQLTLGIQDELHRTRAVFAAVQSIAVRDPATAQKWIDTVPVRPESKAELQAILQRGAQR